MKINQILVCLFVFALAVPCFGQEKEGKEGKGGMFDSKEEYGNFIGSAKRASAENPELRSLIPLINDIAQGQPIGSTAARYGTASSELGLLSNPRIREDIEMVDDQYREFQDRQRTLQKEMAEQLREIDFTDTENLASQIKEIRDSAEREMNELLLPHQVKRLRQLRMQSLLQRRDLVQVLTSDPIKSDLKITDEQSQELRDYQVQMQEDLQREIAKLQDKARSRLLSKLNPSQKKEVEEMIGDTFVFQNARGNAKGNAKGKLEGKAKGKGKAFGKGK
ncbi:MAG: hypothetical protein GY880_11015 [Planctomycetaceae bacterium]|nr:hypothetical protein [Planctomycetaceae bacterium]